MTGSDCTSRRLDSAARPAVGYRIPQTSNAQLTRPRLAATSAGIAVLVCLCVLLVPSVLVGQVLRGLIQLPDSLGLRSLPQASALSPDGRYAYFGGPYGDDVIAVDVFLGRRVARFALGVTTWSLTTIRSGNRVFAVGPDSVTVIDCGSNTIVRKVKVGSGGVVLCENPVAGKVYALDGYRDTLFVLDPSTAEIRSALAVPYAPMLFNSDRNELYVIGGVPDSISVYDGSTDSLLRRFYVTGAGEPIALLPRLNKLYVGGENGVVAIDGASGAVIGGLPSYMQSVLANPRTNRLYGTYDNLHCRAFVFDGTADTLVAEVWLRDSFDVADIVIGSCDTINDKVYIAGYDNNPPVSKLIVLDGTNLHPRAVQNASQMAIFLNYDGAANMTLSHGQRGTLIGLDGATDAEVLRVALHSDAFSFCYNPVHDKLYAFALDILGGVTVIDCRTGRTSPYFWLGSYPLCADADTATGKVYCSLYREDSIAVIDGVGDSLLYKRWCGDRPIGIACMPAPGGSKVYCARQFGGDSVAVFETRDDSLIGMVHTPGTPQWLLPGARNNLVYCFQFVSGVCAIDVGRDSVVAFNPGVIGLNVPSSACFVADVNKLYCASDQDTLYALDGKTLEVVARVRPAISGGELTYVPSARKLYCTMGGRDSVVVIDVQADTIIARLRLAGSPTRPQADALGRFVYVCGDGDSTVSVIDVAGDTVVARFVLPQYVTATTARLGSDRVYAATSRGLVAVFGDSASAVQEPIQAGARVHDNHSAAVMRRGTLLTIGEETRVVDVCGRLRVTLQPGTQTLTGLPAGVYYLLGGAGRNPVRLVLLQ